MKLVLEGNRSLDFVPQTCTLALLFVWLIILVLTLVSVIPHICIHIYNQCEHMYVQLIKVVHGMILLPSKSPTLVNHA